jgi:hypothetical protein
VYLHLANKFKKKLELGHGMGLGLPEDKDSQQGSRENFGEPAGSIK